MSPPECPRPNEVEPHFGAAELQRCSPSRRSASAAPGIVLGPRVARHVRLQRLERDDLRAGVDELLVLADMIRVVLRVDARTSPAGSRPIVISSISAVEVLVAGILGVDDDASPSGVTRISVLAPLAGDHVEVRLELPGSFRSSVPRRRVPPWPTPAVPGRHGPLSRTMRQPRRRSGRTVLQLLPRDRRNAAEFNV